MLNSITQENIKVGEIANGLPLAIPVYRLKGSGAGPSVYIQANMHGAEVQGNAVIYQLLELLKHTPLNGDITLVPYANPIGCNQKSGEFTLGRFDPITGTNWNRMYHDHTDLIPAFVEAHQNLDDRALKAAFKSTLLEQTHALLDGDAYRLTTGKRIALNLQALAHQADLVLDLHTGPISAKHLYCPMYAKESARYFDIQNVLLIPEGFGGAMDEASFCPWWQLSQALAQRNREFPIMVEAFTVELGSQEKIDLEEAKQDAKSILSYLNHKKVIDSNEYQPNQMTRYACYLKDYLAYYAPMGGMVEYTAPLGEPISAGTTIAKILRMEQYLSEQPLHEITLPVDAIPILHFASASVNQGTELYKFFTHYFEL